MKKVSFIFILLLNCYGFSQNSNIFLERYFWKQNPTITQIEKKISEGNNIAALNKFAFDGVVFALLENVDNKTIKHLLTKNGNEVNKKTHDGRTYIFGQLIKTILKL
jgi:hypothetical protein